MKRALLLSAYHAESHRRWCSGLTSQLDDFQWTLLSLPPRHFNWRIRGNSLSWAYLETDTLNRSYDLILATSMVDVAGLRALVPALVRAPTVVYFHENQFAYPRSPRQHAGIEPQMINLYSALCADRVVFNSRYNRDSFLAGVGHLMKRLPDAVPPNLATLIEARSSVLPVPLESHCFATNDAPRHDNRLTLVWNHRWEYDKSPERFHEALTQLPEQLMIRVHVVGQSFREVPPVMESLYALLERRGWLGEWGHIDDSDRYRALLRNSHVVVSTAVHDFQGLALLEAVASGCIPLAPNRLAYPEWFGEQRCYPSADDPHREAAGLAQAVIDLTRRYESGVLPPPPAVDTLAWDVRAGDYRALFAEAMKGS